MMAVLFGARPQYKKLGITNIADACLEYTRTTGTLGLAGLGCSFSKNGYIYNLLSNTDPVLVEVNAVRERQPTPRANLDPMVCKFLQNQVMLNVTLPPERRFRVDSKVITMRQERTT
ncbi:hypothetical protein Trydic_g11761 [Trypoxylus dichotomus]